jgi:hypothetical protein
MICPGRCRLAGDYQPFGMTAAPDPTDRDAAEQQLRMELMTVQIDHGRVE